jgi:hypothetical protein
VISDVVGEHVVPGVGQMLVLDHKIDLDTVVVAPGLAKMPGESGTTHGQSMIEDDQLVALSALSRDVSGFEGSAIIRRDREIVPSSHPIIIGSLEDKTAQRPDDVGNGLDLGVVFGGNALIW